MSDILQLQVDILRGKNYPQSEDEPCPCSTFVRVSLYNASLEETLASPYTTDLQENSNSPFYSASTVFEVSSGLDGVVLLLEVVETTRQTVPYVMLYGSHFVSLSERGKHEVVIVLTSANPVEFPEKAVAEAVKAANDVKSCQLSIRFNIQRPKNDEEFVDVHADVDLSFTPRLDGDCRIVPKDSQYVWLSLLSDRRWIEAFRSALVFEWQNRPPLVMNDELKDGLRRGGEKSSHTKSGPKSASATVKNIRSIGDVIVKRWCCCRLHEVLTRLRLCAEAFNRGERSLYFSREKELSFRLKRKEQVCLLREITLSAMLKTGFSRLRDIVDHMWIFFAIGIDHDPSGRSVLTYEARKRVSEATFTEEDRMVLHSSLLNLLVPSLSLDQCDEITVGGVVCMDAATSAADRSSENAPVASAGSMSVPPGEIDFVTALLDCVGAMLDTLTETELVAAFKAFKPAVFSAQQRIQSGAKEELREARKRATLPQLARPQYKPGSGIKIDHLDILGHRRKSLQTRSEEAKKN